MDTVSMLNKMSFYCQPILPLVYDESMSYYETLCKVVGQLNTTGETVNKLNEGLTGEISDRQAADAALDDRLKAIETEKAKTHFLVFDGANPNGGFPTRSELYQWVHEGDAIFTLFRTNEDGRGQIYAASCSYNAGNWGSEASNDFNIIVPIETSYDATQDYAVKQKVAKLSIPLSPQTNLNVPWRLQIIEVNTPSTSAEGVVNIVAVINDSDSVNCSITPSEFLGLYNTTRGGKNLCVAVNAKLAYDGLARSSSVATVDTTNRKIRIAFERDYGTFTNNGVKQLNKTLDYIIGDVSTNVWTHETIDSKVFDFPRYDGFQFTRGANDVITTDDESTPNAVYTQYHSHTSGKLYQNLPVRLIDTVDNAEYWNGVFDIKDIRHMTFTFVTSNDVSASGKMLVRVIELSADVNTTTWKYVAKEFTIPLTGGGSEVYVDFWPTGSKEYDKDLKAWTVSLGTAQTFDSIFDLISSGANVIARLYKDSTKSELVAKSIGANPSGDKTLGNVVFSFVHAADDVFIGFPTIADSIWVTKAANATSTYALYKWCSLPVPAGDSSDNGKVPIINGTSWELKTPDAGYVTVQSANLLDNNDTANQAPGKLFYVGSSNATLTNANGDTAIYFPVGKWGAGNYKFPIDYIQYGGNAAYNTALFNADKVYIKAKTSTAVDTSDNTAYILSLDITQAEIDSGTYYIGLSIRTSQLGTSAMVVKDMDYPDSYIEYGTTTYKAQKLDNELVGKKASFCGDSICAGTSVGTASPIYEQGWAGIIGKKNSMAWQNLGVNGATVADTQASTGTLIIVNQLAKAYPDADYIILEGGCNDFDQMSGSTSEDTMGKITAGWDDSYIKTTFAGALEDLFYQAVTKHPKAKIGYIIPPLMGRRNWEQYETISYRVYFNLAIDICKKWGIPYLDLWYESPLNPNLTVYYDPSLGVNGNIADASKCYVDGQHLTTTGYELIAPQIEAWMRTL